MKRQLCLRHKHNILFINGIFMEYQHVFFNAEKNKSNKKEKNWPLLSYIFRNIDFWKLVDSFMFFFFKFVSLWIWLSKYCFRSLSWYSSGGLFKLQPAIFSNQKIMTIKFTIFIFVCCVDHRTFFSHWSFQYMVWSSWCFPISRRRLECRIVYSYNAHSSIRWWWFHQWTLCITSRYFWRKNIFKNFYLNPSMFHTIIWKGSIL